MFKRRNHRPWWLKFADLFWPEAGWHRTGQYIFHRVARIPGSPYSITAGFACGAAISFTPFIGLHFVLAAILAWILRGNIITSAIGTAVGNPWTFPFIWVWIYKVGTWLPFVESSRDHTEIDFAQFFGSVTHATIKGNLDFFWDTALPVLWPMFAGSIPTAIVVWVVTYFALNPLVTAYQNRRRHRHHLGKKPVAPSSGGQGKRDGT